MRCAHMFCSLIAAAAVLVSVSQPVSSQTAKWRFGHDQPVPSMYEEGHQAFKRILAEKTKDAIQVDIFPNAQLGPEIAMFEGVRLGSLDGMAIHFANAASFVPELSLFSVSYIFKDQKHYEAVIGDPAFFADVSKLVASKNLGIKLLGIYSAGVRNIYTRKGAASTPEEFKGTKIRVMNNPIEAKIWSTFGGIPTPMNFGEVYQSLQTGVLDAAENGLSTIESFRHYEAAKTIILTEHQRASALLIMNERKFNALSPELQKIVLEAAAEACAIQRRRDRELNAEAVERMTAKGATFITPDRAKFAALIAPIQDDVAQTLKMTDMLKLVRSKAN